MNHFQIGDVRARVTTSLSLFFYPVLVGRSMFLDGTLCWPQSTDYNGKSCPLPPLYPTLFPLVCSLTEK